MERRTCFFSGNSNETNTKFPQTTPWFSLLTFCKLNSPESLKRNDESSSSVFFVLVLFESLQSFLINKWEMWLFYLCCFKGTAVYASVCINKYLFKVFTNIYLPLIHLLTYCSLNSSIWFGSNVGAELREGTRNLKIFYSSIFLLLFLQFVRW